MINQLCAKNRPKVIRKFQKEEFDVIVIGGGVTGAGIALDAASRGIKVALVEMKDFASGTSSRSTKLIHGGLRYLKQFEIALVREIGRERAIVHRLAPHLVTSEKMLLPLIIDGTFGKFMTSLGLMVYDVLAGVESADQRIMLSRETTLEKEPMLKNDIVEGGGLYAEYRTDDARLTMEIIKTASRYGATCLNYIKADEFRYNDQGKVIGIDCTDKLTGDSLSIKSKYIISAAGPWVDELRKLNKSLSAKHLFLSKGVHIVIDHARFPVNQSIYFDVPDGRMIFAIPRGKITYVGTTDTAYKGDINDVLTNQEDADYLIEAVNNIFPAINLSSNDIISSWAGVRPLIYEEGKSASEISRKDEIFESENGLLSIAGGKLTGYRKMAEKIVDLVSKKLKKEHELNFKSCQTDEIPLTGGPFKGKKEVKSYRNAVYQKIRAYGLDKHTAIYLVANYGKQTDLILEHFHQLEDEHPAIRLGRAELWFTLNHELVFEAMDFFMRRTGRLYFDIKSIDILIEPVLQELAAYFQWPEEKITQERKKMVSTIHKASHFEYSAGHLKKLQK